MEFIATPTFSRHRKKLLNQTDFDTLLLRIANAPDAGAVIQGTRGIRTLRFARPGGGKSGGVRVIYFWLLNRDTVILLDVYAKSAKEDLSAAEEKKLANARDEIIKNLK